MLFLIGFYNKLARKKKSMGTESNLIEKVKIEHRKGKTKKQIV